MILAANHRSFLDSIFIPLVIGRRVTFVAKAEYFDRRKTAWFFRGRRPDPDPSRGRQRERGCARGRDRRARGRRRLRRSIPRARARATAFTHRGHTGVARLARRRPGAPIVPVGLVGTDECQPTDKKLPRLFRTVTIRFGAPISPERYAGSDDDALALRQITDEVMFEIVQLCGRYEYRDTYATKQRVEDVADRARHRLAHARARAATRVDLTAVA